MLGCPKPQGARFFAENRRNVAQGLYDDIVAAGHMLFFYWFTWANQIL